MSNVTSWYVFKNPVTITGYRETMMLLKLGKYVATSSLYFNEIKFTKYSRH